MAAEQTALSARPCRQPDNKRSTFDYRRHWKASRALLYLRHVLAGEGPREDQKHNCRRAEQRQLTRFIVRMVITSCCTWAVPSRRAYPSLSLHYDGAGGELSDQNRPPVDGDGAANLPTKLKRVRPSRSLVVGLGRSRLLCRLRRRRHRIGGTLKGCRRGSMSAFGGKADMPFCTANVCF
jgi:hypothetical protein